MFRHFLLHINNLYHSLLCCLLNQRTKRLTCTFWVLIFSLLTNVTNMTDLGANLSFLSILVYFIWNILYIGYLGKFVSYWAVLNPEIMKLHRVIVTEQFYTIFEVYEIFLKNSTLSACCPHIYKPQHIKCKGTMWGRFCESSIGICTWADVALRTRVPTIRPLHFRHIRLQESTVKQRTNVPLPLGQAWSLQSMCCAPTTDAFMLHPKCLNLFFLVRFWNQSSSWARQTNFPSPPSTWCYLLLM